jgi:hypothetical protein
MKRMNFKGEKTATSFSTFCHSLLMATAFIVVFVCVLPISGNAQSRWERCGNKLKDGVKMDAIRLTSGPDGMVMVSASHDGMYESDELESVRWMYHSMPDHSPWIDLRRHRIGFV